MKPHSSLRLRMLCEGAVMVVLAQLLGYLIGFGIRLSGPGLFSTLGSSHHFSFRQGVDELTIEAQRILKRLVRIISKAAGEVSVQK